MSSLLLRKLESLVDPVFGTSSERSPPPSRLCSRQKRKSQEGDRSLPDSL